MLSTSLNSNFVLIDTVYATDGGASSFGKNIQYLSDDLFVVTSDLTSPWIGEDLTFTDGSYFDGGYTNFGQLFSTYGQKVDIFQILKTNRNWINSSSDVLNVVPVSSIPITGNNSPSIVYSGAIDNFFLTDASNPSESIKIFNNSSLSHGWAVYTAQQQRLDSGSISRAWIYEIGRAHV